MRISACVKSTPFGTPSQSSTHFFDLHNTSEEWLFGIERSCGFRLKIRDRCQPNRFPVFGVHGRDPMKVKAHPLEMTCEVVEGHCPLSLILSSVGKHRLFQKLIQENLFSIAFCQTLVPVQVRGVVAGRRPAKPCGRKPRFALQSAAPH